MTSRHTKVDPFPLPEHVESTAGSSPTPSRGIYEAYDEQKHIRDAEQDPPLRPCPAPLLIQKPPVQDFRDKSMIEEHGSAQQRLLGRLEEAEEKLRQEKLRGEERELELKKQIDETQKEQAEQAKEKADKAVAAETKKEQASKEKAKEKPKEEKKTAKKRETSMPPLEKSRRNLS